MDGDKQVSRHPLIEHFPLVRFQEILTTNAEAEHFLYQESSEQHRKHTVVHHHAET